MITHCKNPHDVYIGRPKAGQDWNFGNPFVIGVDGDRTEVIEKDKKWLIFGQNFGNKDATPARRRWILSNLSTIKDKTLGCWCDYPKEDCHGRILEELAAKKGTPKILAVIGTAGRKDDAAKLTKNHYYRMIDAARVVIRRENYISKIVSGGAAWADSVATEFVGLYPIEVFIPSEANRDSETLKFYHKKFGRVIERPDTYDDLLKLSIDKKIELHYTKGSFWDRNTKVAEWADVYLAMTFGNGKNIKPGGTSDTVEKIKRFNPEAIGYHLDLNTLKLYKI